MTTDSFTSSAVPDSADSSGSAEPSGSSTPDPAAGPAAPGLAADSSGAASTGTHNSDSGCCEGSLPCADTVFVLASASPARASTLRNAGIEPLIRVSNADEDAVLARFPHADSASDAPAKVVALAQAKAEAVVPTITAQNIRTFAREHDMCEPSAAIVVACDSMLEVGGALLGKPHSPEVAFDRIRELSGSDVTLHTGHAVVYLELDADSVVVRDQHAASCATTVHFTELDDDEIRAYIATGEPLEVAGSFTIDGLGGPFIQGVTGDPHSVVGISLPLVRSIAKEVGVFWPTLWNRRG